VSVDPRARRFDLLKPLPDGFVLRSRHVRRDPVERLLDTRYSLNRVRACLCLRPQRVHVRPEDRHVVEDGDERGPLLIASAKRARAVVNAWYQVIVEVDFTCHH